MILVADTSSCSPRICAARSALQRCHQAMAACWDLRVPDPFAAANDGVLAGGMRAEVTSPTSSWPYASHRVALRPFSPSSRLEWRRPQSQMLKMADGMTVCRGAAP